MEHILQRVPQATIDKILIKDGKTLVFFSNPWLPMLSYDDSIISCHFWTFHADVLFHFQDVFKCIDTFTASNNLEVLFGFISGLAQHFCKIPASKATLQRMLTMRQSFGNFENSFECFNESDHVDYNRLDYINRCLTSEFVNLPKLPYIVQTIYGVGKPRPPIWIHRQAGRYLPEYMKLKDGRNFLEITADPQLSSEITLQPVWRYSMDAAIIFSDIMVVPQALGMELEMRPGPYFPQPIKSLEDVSKLKYKPSVLDHVYDALRLTKLGLAKHDAERYKLPHTALIGFCGAPWTVMSYMVGRDIAADFVKNNKELTHMLLRKITDVSIDYLSNQVLAGADMVQVFDSFVGELPVDLYLEFEEPYLIDIANQFSSKHPTTPIQIFPRELDPNLINQLIAKSNYWTISVSQTFGTKSIQDIPLSTGLQGNFSPDYIYLPDDEIRALARDMIRTFEQALPTHRSRYIVNLGHGTKPDMDPLKIGILVDEVKSLFMGSRASPLALAQADIVSGLFKDSPFHIKTRTFTTTGDKILDKSLSQIGSKGLFTRELECAILDGVLHFAQHSLKDLETKLNPGLCIAAITKRHSKLDCLVFSADKTWTCMSHLPPGTVVGTSALRRAAYLNKHFPHLVIKNIRGTVGTRLSKLLNTNEYDALILAESGLDRLMAYQPDLKKTLPKFNKKTLNGFYAAGQGAIAIECASTNTSLIYYLRKYLENYQDAVLVENERRILQSIEGGCQVPFGIKIESFEEDDSFKERELLKRYPPELNWSEKIIMSAFVCEQNGEDYFHVDNKTGKDLAQLLAENNSIEKVKISRLKINTD
eukprot:NODE_164_length_16443_cov_0.166544.p1 type:complete len:819 gc:universal NODE_164_length_16443_cov_0.166544:10069-7613(-)